MQYLIAVKKLMAEKYMLLIFENRFVSHTTLQKLNFIVAVSDILVYKNIIIYHNSFRHIYIKFTTLTLFRNSSKNRIYHPKTGVPSNTTTKSTKKYVHNKPSK